MIGSKYRRLFAALAMFMLLGAPLYAQAASPARQAMEKTINAVLELMKSPDFKNQATRDAQIDKIEAEVENAFDFQEFSARTVGPRWKEFTPDQKTRFTAAFSKLLRSTYIDQLKEYNGEAVVFTGESSSTKGDKVEINTMVQLQDKAIPVNYRLLQKENGWAVYDVIIENVSLVQNYRSQFQDLLNKGSADDLIAQVNKKAEETKAAARRQ